MSAKNHNSSKCHSFELILADEHGTKANVNLLNSVLESVGVVCNSLNFSVIPRKLSTNALFLQSTIEFEPVEVLFSSYTSGFARYTRQSVSRKVLVLRMILLDMFDASEKKKLTLAIA